MKLILLLPILLLCGCFRIITDDQIDIIKQSIADGKAASEYIIENTEEQGTKLAGEAAKGHTLSVAGAMEIDPRDLPDARVTKIDWKYDYNRASEQTSSNLKRDSYSISTMVTATVIMTMIAGIGLKMGAQTLTATPVGGFVNFLSTLFGHAPQVKRDVYNKLLVALEQYKDIDPDWKTNKLYVLLSDKLTTAEKDLIKKERHEL